MGRRPVTWRWLAAPLLCLCAFAVQAESSAEVAVRTASVELHQDVYYLDARIDYRLGPEVVEALDSGVTLTFQLRVELEEPRRWWMDREVAVLNQRYSLRFHALSGRYVLTSLNTGSSRSFATRAGALYALGRVDGLPLLDRRLLEAGTMYTARVQAALDTAALPLPLRTLAVVSPAWRLGSEWYEWHFEG